MDNKELDIIKELMEQLQGEMQYGKDDFEERLGRKKPEMQVIKIEGELPKEGDDELEEKEELLGRDLDGDMEQGEDPEHAAMVLGRDMEEKLSPEDELKKRLMKLRG
jgi:hypothetical protein